VLRTKAYVLSILKPNHARSPGGKCTGGSDGLSTDGEARSVASIREVFGGDGKELMTSSPTK